MAKKAIAKLQTTKEKGVTKIVKAVRSPKTGAYIFKEKIVDSAKAKEAIKNLK
jgi:hypothetical protein